MKTFRGVSIQGWFALVLLVTVLFLFSWHTLTSIYQDIGRHLTIGEIIWKTREIPRTNLFSYTAPDFPFINHHWLGEVWLYAGERLVGLSGLIAVKAVLLSTAFALALAAAWRKSVLLPSLLVGIVSILVIVERTDVRPEILSFLFLGWYLFVLYRKPDSRLVWTLPVIQLLWVNTHIYFFMGPFVFVAWGLGLFATRGRAVFRDGRLWLLGFLIAAGTLANPWFIDGALYPFSIFDNYGYSIVENKSYFFLRSFGYPGFTFSMMILGLVLFLLSLGLNHRRLRHNVMSIILVGGSFVLALLMVRNMPLLGFVMLPAILKNLAESRIAWPQRGAGIAALVLGLLSVSIIQGQFAGRISPGNKQFGLVVPAGHQRAVDYYRVAQLQGPIYNNFDIGSYLIWKLPEEPVFVDGRPEAYPAGFMQEVYIRSQEKEAVWNEVLETYGMNVVFWNTRDITPWSAAFLERIQQDPDWSLTYFEDQIAIFVRKSGINAPLPDIRSGEQ